MGRSFLKSGYHKVELELRMLQDENARLKKIVGNRHWNWNSKQNF
jgi:hypothetical protein